LISNSGIEVPGISLIKDFDEAQREYHQAWVAGDTNQETTPFVWVLLAQATAASIHPYVLPPTVTLEAAAAPSLTLVTMLIVVGILLLIMLIYNGYQYLVFRGKVSGSGYGGYEE
jgi:cytochrome bd-type quinol oxidase subunit 2